MTGIPSEKYQKLRYINIGRQRWLQSGCLMAQGAQAMLRWLDNFLDNDGEFEDFNAAQAGLDTGDLPLAEKSLNSGLQKSINRGDAEMSSFYLFQLGGLHLRRGNKDDALEYFERARDESVGYYPKINYARVIALAYNDYCKAEQTLLRIIPSIPPMDPALNSAYSVLGYCRLMAGDTDGAVVAFKKSFQVDADRFTGSDGFDLLLFRCLLARGIYVSEMKDNAEVIRSIAEREGNAPLVREMDDINRRTVKIAGS